QRQAPLQSHSRVPAAGRQAPIPSAPPRARHPLPHQIPVPLGLLLPSALRAPASARSIRKARARKAVILIASRSYSVLAAPVALAPLLLRRLVPGLRPLIPPSREALPPSLPLAPESCRAAIPRRTPALRTGPSPATARLRNHCRPAAGTR